MKDLAHFPQIIDSQRVEYCQSEMLHVVGISRFGVPIERGIVLLRSLVKQNGILQPGLRDPLDKLVQRIAWRIDIDIRLHKGTELSLIHI